MPYRVALALLLVACGVEPGLPDGGTDAGGTDAALMSDAGPEDAGAADAGPPLTGCAAGCAGDEYCETLPGDCAATEDSCTLVPELCSPGGPEVCGCDGTTYDSDCERRRARVSKAFDGPCAALVCEPPCSGGSVCWYASGAAMMGCGVMGECTLPSPECDFAPDEPVCGCDGVTYSNPSCALNAGAGVASSGACP